MRFLTPGDKGMFAFSKARECRHRAEEHRTRADCIRATLKAKLEMEYYKVHPAFAEFVTLQLNELIRQTEDTAKYLDTVADYFEDYGQTVGFGVK